MVLEFEIKLTIIAMNSKQTFFSTSNNRIGSDGPAKLVSALLIHPTLGRLKIGLNPLGDKGVQTILKAASVNTALQFLSFEVSQQKIIILFYRQLLQTTILTFYKAKELQISFYLLPRRYQVPVQRKL